MHNRARQHSVSDGNSQIRVALFIVPSAFVLCAIMLLTLVILPYMPLIRTAYRLAIGRTPVSPAVSAPTASIHKSTALVVTDDLSVLPDIEDNAGERVSLSDVVMPKYEQEYGNLRILSVGIDLPLIFGDSNDALKRGACQYMGTKLPGFGSPVLVAAHNTPGFFLPLREIEIGDSIDIETDYGEFTYEVTETKVIFKDDFDLNLLQKEEEILMLYTCYPFGTLGFKVDRYFVFAQKVSGPVVDW